MLSAVQSLIMSSDKKLLLIIHVITKEIEYNIEHFHLYVVVKMFFFFFFFFFFFVNIIT